LLDDVKKKVLLSNSAKENRENGAEIKFSPKTNAQDPQKHTLSVER
jgi:hypothetical protein